MLSVLKRKDLDMTQGNILHLLINFAIPLLIGNLFQQLYNTVDTYVVGNYVSKGAFAAVGSVGPIINTAIGFYMGFATGAGVVISQYSGAKDYKKLSSAVATSIIITICMCVLFTVAGTLTVPYMLGFMKTPDDVIMEAKEYLSIYFIGISGLMLYNIGSGILRAVGNSFMPFIALCISALVNVVLDLWFVLGFHMGVAGVAWATIISQALSAVFVLTVLTITKAPYRIIWRKLVPSAPIFAQIFKIGIPAALQMAVTSFSNVFVQSYINDFGSDCMAGWSSYNKIDAFALLPMQSLSLSVTTFTGQNLGAGKISRVKRGVKFGIIISCVITAVLIVPIMLFADELVYIFHKDPNVIEYGAHFLRWISPFYLLCVVNQILAGVLRGAGVTRAPMFIMLGSFVLFRQIYLHVLSSLTQSVMVITFAYPAGWLVCSLIMLIYYRYSGWIDKRVNITGIENERETPDSEAESGV